MVKPCAVCGSDFDAQRDRALYCSGRCKKRAADARKRGTVMHLAPMPTVSTAADDRAGVHAATIAFFAPDSLESPRGQLALKLARDVDACVPGTPGYSGLVKELREVLAELSSPSARSTANPLTLIRERHAGQRTAG